MSNPHICPAHLDDALDLLRINAAAAVIDVHAAGLVVRHGDVRAELAQNAWRRFVGSTIRHIDSDAHFIERHAARETRFCKFHIATERVVDTRGAPDFVSSWPDGINLAVENEPLDFFFDLIIQFITIVPEKFDAVILIRIVRGRKDDAGIGAQ